MSATKKGGPAFPFEYHNQTRTDQDGFFGTGKLKPDAAQQFAGMSLRDYFAAKAMQGMCVRGYLPETFGTEGEFTLDGYAKKAYAIADAMLATRGES